MSTLKGPASGLPALLALLLAVTMLVTGCATTGQAGTSTSSSTAGSTTSPAAPSPTSSAVPPSAPSSTAGSSVVALPASPIRPVGIPGVNDTSCTSADRPVVLLHGTFSSVKADFAAMVPALLAAGRCVYGIDYGNGGLAPVRQSAAEVTAFVDQVLTTTGAEQVDVIGYSQGGLVLRTALRLNALAPDVAVAVLIAPSFHGSTSPLLTALPSGICAACADQVAGSALLSELDAGGDLDGAVRYAVVSSADDTIVTPVAAQVPQGPADQVSSILVQDSCPTAVVDHIGLRTNPGVVSWTVNALQTGGSPDPAALTCG